MTRNKGKIFYLFQVDCFSFGMFMFELMSLQRPFECLVGKDVGRLSEVIKQLIKDGQRPVLSRKVGSSQLSPFSFFSNLNPS